MNCKGPSQNSYTKDILSYDETEEKYFKTGTNLNRDEFFVSDAIFFLSFHISIMEFSYKSSTAVEVVTSAIPSPIIHRWHRFATVLH
jgi:hypothetical protein